jgi:imidazole glycerol-phosphate synthase subunit HisF
MIKKRLIGVITVKNSIAVQSMEYSHYLPIGAPEVLIENLERWGVDEIIVLSIDRSQSKLGPDLKLISRIASMGLTTPLSYGGGIRSLEDAVSVIQSGAERVVLDSLLIKDLNQALQISRVIGAQALIASMPLAFIKNKLMHFDYIKKSHLQVSDHILDAINSRKISEVMIIDHKNEGLKSSFQEELLNHFAKKCNLIAFGGVSTPKQVKKLMGIGSIVGVGVGNFLNYKEHSVDLFKGNLKGSVLRS